MPCHAQEHREGRTARCPHRITVAAIEVAIVAQLIGAAAASLCSAMRQAASCENVDGNTHIRTADTSL
jgi:hypothetical protein